MHPRVREERIYLSIRPICLNSRTYWTAGFSGQVTPMLLMITIYQFTNTSKIWRDRDGHTAAIGQPRYDYDLNLVI
jgi:hypothetical protein